MISGDPPGYWMFEASGVLRPAIEAYLTGQHMTEHNIAAMRAYLRQWIAAPGWRGSGIDQLRAEVDQLNTRAEIALWLDEAMELGIDPL